MQLPRHKIWLFVGSVLGLLAVALGAFGAHGLKSLFQSQGFEGYDLDRRIAPWNTAAHYQLVHAVALLGVGLLAARRCGLAINLAGTALTLGTLIFSGCMYGFVLYNHKLLAMMIPIGGLLLIAGWLCLAIAAWQQPDD